MDLPLPVLMLGLTFPVVMAIVDCHHRPADTPPDRRAWLGWPAVAVVTVPALVGHGIVIGYYCGVVRRNSPASPT